MPKKIDVRPQSLSEALEAKERGDTMTVMAEKALMVIQAHTFRRIGRRLSMIDTTSVKGFPHYVPVGRTDFRDIAHPLIGWLTRGQISDIYEYITSMVPCLDHNTHLVLMGKGVWDTRTLDWDGTDHSEVVWRSPYNPVFDKGPVQFILDAAGGDEGNYEDIIQSMAPILMDQKPDGAIWWVGDGANGKSSLMEALYRIFPGQLASLTVKGLSDGRDTPMLNGHLANVVKESSEGRVEDTQVYKSIGTHEDFRVHKFLSQDMELVKGNMHHIFSANRVPSFNDKGFSALRRTIIIPFNQVFVSDPEFNARTFVPDVLGQILGEMIRCARDIKSRKFLYKFSAITEGAKAGYDAEANNAEDYARELLRDGVVGFDSFTPVRIDYENWCARNGYPALGITYMRTALHSVGFERKATRVGPSMVNRYVIKTVMPADMIAMTYGRSGFYTAEGFERQAPLTDKEKEFEHKQAVLADWNGQ
jgi:hypothetical protein